MKNIAITLVCLAVSACGSGNLDYVKAHGAEVWRANGWQPVGYEGYQWATVVPFTSYGGACVWWRLRSVPDNGITYDGCLQRWGDEIHIYSLTAIDAIKPGAPK